MAVNHQVGGSNPLTPAKLLEGEIMKIKEGSKVRIRLTCTNTKENCGINSLMTELFGSIQTVTSIYNDTVQIQEWNWHIKDLMLIDEKAPRKKIEIQLFDTNNLDV